MPGNPKKNRLKWMDVWYFGDFPTIFHVKIWNHHPIDSQPLEKIGRFVEGTKVGVYLSQVIQRLKRAFFLPPQTLEVTSHNITSPKPSEVTFTVS